MSAALIYSVATGLQVATVFWLGRELWKARERAEEAERREEKAEQRAYRESNAVIFYMSKCARLMADLQRLRSKQ